MTTSARAMMHLLFHGEKAVDVLRASLDLGLLERLDAGPVSLRELGAALGLVPTRLYKLLDCLESLGMVERFQDVDDLLEARYRSREPLHEAALAVLGPASIERDRDKYRWREIHGRLPEVLRGEHGMPREAFDWPPRTPEQVAGFEESMAAGMAPILESFLAARPRLWGQGSVRLLDVGGGDGALAQGLLRADPSLRVDVLNLPAVEPLVARRRAEDAAGERLGFVPCDFLAEPLPSAHDALLFVRVLHDWPAETARLLLRKAHAALAPGGRVVISEELRNAERLAVQFFWTYFLIGVDGCVSRLREEEFYLRALVELGFRDVEVIRGSFDIIVATR